MTDEPMRSSRWVLAVAVLAAVGAGFVLRAQLVGAEFSGLDILGVNHLAAGRLDVEAGESTTTLAVENMAPGDVARGRLEIRNAGSLPLIYALGATVDDGGLASNLELSSWLGGDCDVTPATGLLIDAAPLDRTEAIFGNQAPGRQAGDRRLAVGATETMCFIVTLPLDATNDAQGRTGTQTFTVFAEHDIGDGVVPTSTVLP